MFNLLLLAFVFAALTIILVLSIAGALILQKKTTHANPRINPENVVDVTAKDEN